MKVTGHVDVQMVKGHASTQIRPYTVVHGNAAVDGVKEPIFIPMDRNTKEIGRKINVGDKAKKPIGTVTFSMDAT